MGISKAAALTSQRDTCPFAAGIMGDIWDFFQNVALWRVINAAL